VSDSLFYPTGTIIQEIPESSECGFLVPPSVSVFSRWPFRILWRVVADVIPGRLRVDKNVSIDLETGIIVNASQGLSRTLSKRYFSQAATQFL
jgi:hypothetical protein